MSKTVIITGAAGNLGSATVRQFLHAGYRVFGTVEPSRPNNHLPSHNQLSFHEVDVVSPSSAAAFVEEVAQSSRRIHAVVMLVGGFAMGDIEATEGEESIEKMFRLNFHSAYNIARPAISHMKQHDGGRLVFIGAKPALEAELGKGLMAYALSKSLIFELARLINAEGKGHNIVASVVVPSIIDTPPNRAAMPNAKFEDWVKPKDLADMIEYACRDKARALREPVLKMYGNV